MITKRKIIVGTLFAAMASLAVINLYSNFISDEGRFRRSVVNKLTSLQQGEIEKLPLTSFEGDWEMVCVLGPYQGGSHQAGNMPDISSWIQSKAIWSVDEMPMAMEGEWLLVFGFQKNLISIEFPWKPRDFDERNIEFVAESCWLKGNTALKNLHFELKSDAVILQKGGNK